MSDKNRVAEKLSSVVQVYTGDIIAMRHIKQRLNGYLLSRSSSVCLVWY